jgi:hypothetical protein
MLNFELNGNSNSNDTAFQAIQNSKLRIQNCLHPPFPGGPMTTTHNIIRDAAAAGHLAAFAALGVTLDLTHDGVTAAGLVASLPPPAESESDGRLARGVAAERLFLIPRQPGFAGEIDPGDTITYPGGSADTHTVRSIQTDALESVYHVAAVKNTAAGGAQIEQITFEITHSGGGSTLVTLAGPLDARIRESVEFLALRAGPCSGPVGLALQSQSLDVDIVTLDLDDNIPAQAKGSLALSVKTAAGASASITVTGLKRAGCEWNCRQSPNTRRLTFSHEGGMASPPVSVSV